MSGHGKKANLRRALTFWKQQGEGLVKPRKETYPATRTHMLEIADGGSCQDMGRNRPNEAHSLPGDGRGGDLSGQEKKQGERGALTSWRWQRKNLSGHEEKPTERRTLTNWGRQRKGHVRTRKETDREMHTHQLGAAEGGICQDTERNRTSDVHLLAGDSRGRDLSGHEKKPTQQR